MGEHDADLNDFFLGKGARLAHELAKRSWSLKPHGLERLRHADEGPLGVYEAEHWRDGNIVPLT